MLRIAAFLQRYMIILLVLLFPDRFTCSVVFQVCIICFVLHRKKNRKKISDSFLVGLKAYKSLSETATGSDAG